MELDRLGTEELLRLAGSGNDGAIGRLLERHRGRLRRMVAARLNRRVAARVDASDVVQDALGAASGRLAEFARERPVSFYAWLKRLTLERLSWSHRYHLGARKRCAARDVSLATTPCADSAAAALDQLPDTGTSPSQHVVRHEECELVRAGLDRLNGADRTLLELRYIERLSLAEIGGRLGIGPSAVKMRHLRALKRFRAVLEATDEEPAS
jgi:RNA polymerase sigma-70 factor (ECF subfamily)